MLNESNSINRCLVLLRLAVFTHTVNLCNDPVFDVNLIHLNFCVDSLQKDELFTTNISALRSSLFFNSWCREQTIRFLIFFSNLEF